MVLNRSRRTIRTTRLILLICSWMSCFLILVPVFSLPAHAAFGAYEPSEYVYGCQIDGDVKHVTFKFADIDPLIYVTNNAGYVSKYVGESFTFYPTAASNGASVNLYPLGVMVYGGNGIYNKGSINVSDIAPGTDLSLTLKFTMTYSWNEVYDGNVVLTFSPRAICYDADGNYVKIIKAAETTKSTWDMSSDDDGSVSVPYGLDLNLELPRDVSYIAPFLVSTITHPTDAEDKFVFEFIPQPLTMSCDINMIYENSATMNAINDKLDDISSSLDGVNDKLDDTNEKLDGIGDSLDQSNEKLDDIISGGQAGADMNAAGDELVDSFDQVDDFEQDMMQNFEDGMAGLDPVTGVGNFGPSLAFVSRYVQRMFEGVEEWSIVIVLPVFMGILMYVCSRSGAVTHVIRSAERAGAERHRSVSDPARSDKG